ncbi:MULTISPECIES: OmpP1/FadL family transporter [unclassified Roseibium]|uniref:OmpP1/FadL family transporter n=1 Tax=unclassified Roseibium TaxID=2629323 RepID=UPI00273EFC4B|nr:MULTISPECIES: outer membrane protein transport protein [unclassified Roseibium]
MGTLKVWAANLMIGGTVFCCLSPAYAGGWDTLGVGSNELLFDDSRFAFEATTKAVDRNVDYEVTNAEVAGRPVVGGPVKSRATPNIWNYQFAAKFRLTDQLDCMARTNDPYQIEEDLNQEWQGRFSLTRTSASGKAFNGTCAYKFKVRDGHYVRAIAGANLLYLRYRTDNLSYGAFIPPSTYVDFPTRLDVRSDDPGVGWRVGASYEIPQYAVRASLIYDSAIDVDLAGGTEVTGVTSFDSFASVTMPQSLEFNLQTGIAPDWLATFGVKWVDWSKLQDLTVQNPAGSTVVNRFLGYDDGWTVRAGLAHKVNDWLKVGSTVQWDRGIGQSYSDTYSFGVGTAIQLDKHAELTIGTAATYKASGTGDLTNLASTSGATTQYKYGDSWNYTLQTKLKFSF